MHTIRRAMGEGPAALPSQENPSRVRGKLPAQENPLAPPSHNAEVGRHGSATPRVTPKRAPKTVGQLQHGEAGRSGAVGGYSTARPSKAARQAPTMGPATGTQL